MKVAIVVCGLHRGRGRPAPPRMATFKFTGGSATSTTSWSRACVSRGYPRDFAERTFKQIEGFGSYGFPESHAASFAKIAYASCWMKHIIPTCFARHCSTPSRWASTRRPGRPRRARARRRGTAGLHQRQPLGLYAGTDRGRYLAVRLGLRQVRGLANAHGGAAIVAARGDAPFQSVEEVWRRAGVPRAAIERLAEADAFHALGEDRRQGLWKVKGLGETPLPCSPPPMRAKPRSARRGWSQTCRSAR